MTYSLKTTGIPAAHTVKACLVVDDSNNIVDLVSGNTIVVDAGVTIGTGSWNGTPRKYFETTEGGAFSPRGVSWNGTQPSLALSAGVGGMTMFAAVENYTGGSGNSPGAIIALSGTRSIRLINAAGQQRLSTRGSVEVWTANANNLGTAKASYIAKAISAGALSGKQGAHGSALVSLGSGTEAGFLNGPQPLDRAFGVTGDGTTLIRCYCLLVIEGQTTGTEDDALHLDWFTELITATASPLSFSGTVPSQGGTVGTAFAWAGAALSSYFAGGTAPVSYAVQTGTLPAGLTLNSSTGVVSGTPTAAGSGAVVIRATDSAGTPTTASTNSFTFTIGSAPTPVSFSGTVPAQSGTVGTSFSLALASYFSGSLSPFTYSVLSGALPPGLSLNTSTGSITGTPTSAGSYSAVVRATDTGSNTAQTGTISFTVAAAGGGGGTTYSVQMGPFSISTGSGPLLSTAVSYTLYPGVDVGAISGTPINGSGVTDASTGALVVSGLAAAGSYLALVKNAAGTGRWMNLVTAGAGG